MILAPLRGVTIRCFREVFADVIRETGFTEAITPFIAALPGYDPLKDREINNRIIENNQNNRIIENNRIKVTPQFIGKDPAALRVCLEKIRDAGYDTADLNCGCPYPMVRCKGRGSGILRTPDVLEKMLETGCSVMGEGRFSIKARLGVEKPDELLALMPVINRYPLRFLTVHARTARQMYGGQCDWESYKAIESVAKVPLVRNGDLPLPREGARPTDATGVRPADGSGAVYPRRPSALARREMIGRSFIVSLGERDDIGEYLRRYIDASRKELSGDASVLGRLKELIAYWKLLPAWHRRWNVVKLCRSVDELLSSLPG